VKSVGRIYRRIIPNKLRNTLFKWRKDVYIWLRYRGKKYHCGICNSNFRKMRPFDLRSRSRPGGVYPPVLIPNSVCPRCYSNLRHRLFWEIFSSRFNSEVNEKPIRILHFAPESHLSQKISSLNKVEYLTADITRPDVDLNLDLTRLELPDCDFDVIIAIHVLEHIEDDRAALTEIYRILNPGGWTVLMVPIFGEYTHEDNNITTEEDRIKFFGQGNHVRAYGIDFRDRLTEIGFNVETILYQDVFKNKEDRNLLHDSEGILLLASK